MSRAHPVAKYLTPSGPTHLNGSNHKTPSLLVYRPALESKVREIKEALDFASICYAVKANPATPILRAIKESGLGFEVASDWEVDLLLRLGVAPQRIISSNPLSPPSLVQHLHRLGGDTFTTDSLSELDKVAQYAPGARVVVRLAVDNSGSEWPLSKKFGVEVEQALAVLARAREKRLQPYGVTFHVGSQCVRVESWVKALHKVKSLWGLAHARGISLRSLNLGGGFPIRYTQDVPSLKEIGAAIKGTLREEFPQDIELLVEPGRALVGEAGVMVGTVIARAERGKESWLYLDVGVFNGLMEALGGITYPFFCDRQGPLRERTVAGPSCDGFDVIANKVLLPELEVGDRVYIGATGAYTTVYASNFNGFAAPRVRFVSRPPRGLPPGFPLTTYR